MFMTWRLLVLKGCFSSLSDKNEGVVAMPMRSGRSSAMSTNSPAWIRVTSLQGTSGKPAPMERTEGGSFVPYSLVLSPVMVETWSSRLLSGTTPKTPLKDTNKIE